MKNVWTMLKVSKAYAESFGARIWNNTRCGYFLTIQELNDLYMSQGFNHLGTAMRRPLDAWMAEDKAVVEGSEYDPSAAVWFACPPEKATLVKVRSEQCGGRYVVGIDRMDWPVLRRMHGIQEVLP